MADELEGGYRIRASKLTITETATRSALMAQAAKWVQVRGSREAIFGTGLFAEPAWDMLLFLFLKAGEQKRVLKTAVTNASGVSHSTALRYLSLLEKEGLVQVEKTQRDNRAQLVSLTPGGLLKISACIARSLRKERYDLDALADALPTKGKEPLSSLSRAAAS
ncbi:hypothetical protein [Aurantiacibacter hainanensis]|uniref:hypothetical protein n=1 Tax=Aurantiacibacter hainanensis TaxID=3076114 RepID=UPI0030C6C698